MSASKDDLSDLRIRPATRSDLAAVIALMPESTSGVVTALFDQDALLERLSDPGRHTGLRSCAVACMGEQVVGHAISYDDEAAKPERPPPDPESGNAALRDAFGSLRAPRSWYLSSIAVAPDWRRRGIGRALMAHVAGRARAAGVELLSLHVFAEKQAALALYASMGLREAGRIRIPFHPGVTARSDLLLMTGQAGSVLARAGARSADPRDTPRQSS